MTDPDRAEEIRFAIRRYLASCPTAAVPMDVIQHALRMKGLKASDIEILNELTYWIETDPPQVKCIKAEHSSLKTWQITSQGRLAHDRGE